MPEGVSKEQFLTITKAWKDIVVKSDDDLRTCAMMGVIQKHLPEFFSWLQKQKPFDRVRDVKLHEFISTMKDISKLKEDALTKLIINIEGSDHEKKESEDTNDNSDL